MRVIIAGGRDFNDRSTMVKALNGVTQSIDKKDLVIISGMARGADLLGYKLGKKAGVTVEEFPADWDRLGKRAGYVRNAEMADAATHLIAFWDGKSRGTKHMIDLAKKKGLSVLIVKY